MNRYGDCWNAPRYGAFQNQQIPNPPRIGDCMNYANNPSYNYYNQYGTYPNMMYNTMYNPYEQERIRKEQEEQKRQKFLSERKFHNEMSRLSAGYLGIPYEQQTPEEELKAMEDYYRYLQNLQSFKEEHSGFDTEGFKFIEFEPEPVPVEQEESNVDPCEWINNMGYMIAKLMEQEVIKQRNNLSKAYNSANYNQLLQMHNRSSYDPYTMTSIDDMEVRLPSELNTEYQKRREKFMQALIG